MSLIAFFKLTFRLLEAFVCFLEVKLDPQSQYVLFDRKIVVIMRKISISALFTANDFRV